MKLFQIIRSKKIVIKLSISPYLIISRRSQLYMIPWQENIIFHFMFLNYKRKTLLGIVQEGFILWFTDELCVNGVLPRYSHQFLTADMHFLLTTPPSGLLWYMHLPHRTWYSQSHTAMPRQVLLFHHYSFRIADWSCSLCTTDHQPAIPSRFEIEFIECLVHQKPYSASVEIRSTPLWKHTCVKRIHPSLQPSRWCKQGGEQMP